jgi:hypothetical protein
MEANHKNRDYDSGIIKNSLCLAVKSQIQMNGTSTSSFKRDVTAYISEKNYSISYKCASKQAIKILFSVGIKVTLIFKVACSARTLIIIC